MKMIDSIPIEMIASCGVNCLACSAYLADKSPCAGCRAPEALITRKSCINCVKKKCAFDKGLKWCFECAKFPCTRIKALSKRYVQNYGVDLIKNGIEAKEDMDKFLAQQKERFTCHFCGGIIDQHHKKCSECGTACVELAIEQNIIDLIVGDSQRNALNFIKYLRKNDMVFERGGGYWEDKFYLLVKYKNDYVCFVLINNEEKTDPESWTVWSDDSDAITFGDSSADEKTKEIIWEHVIVCDNVKRCFDGCKRGHKTILGKEFDNVCGTTIKFENPNAETVECMKKMVEIRKNDICNLPK